MDIPNKEVKNRFDEKSSSPNYVASKTPETNTMVAYLPVISVMVIWMLLYVVCKRFCLPFLNVIMKYEGTTRCFILYSVCWAIM